MIQLPTSGLVDCGQQHRQQQQQQQQVHLLQRKTMTGSAGKTMAESAGSSVTGNGEPGDLRDQEEEEEEGSAVRNMLWDSLGSDSQNKVRDLLCNIEALGKTERLLLYMDLPNNQPSADPLRQPINPLGSRSEIQLTITWIKAHLEEDPQVSMPKHEVYDEYMEYCNDASLKALSTADFGKVMKQVYPQVRPRRLGTRGNSRYCYAGLRKKVKIENPNLCDPVTNHDLKQTVGQMGAGFGHKNGGGAGAHAGSSPTQEEDSFEQAAVFLVLEWVEKVLSVKVGGIQELARYLLDKMYVDGNSVAAQTVTSKGANRPDGSNRFTTGPDSAFGTKLEDVKRKSSAMYQVKEEDTFRTKRKKLEPVDFHDDQDKLESQLDSLSNDGFPLLPPPAPEFRQQTPQQQPQQQQQQQQSQQLLAHAQHHLLHAGTTGNGEPDENKTNIETDPKWSNDGGSVPPLQQQQQQDSFGSSDPHLSQDKVEDEMNSYFNNVEDPSNSAKNDKLSQLRQILEKNLKSSTPSSPVVVVNSAFRPTEPKLNVVGNSCVVEAGNGGGQAGGGAWGDGGGSSANNGAGPAAATPSSTSLCNRRRVSFNPLVVQDTGGHALTGNNGNSHGPSSSNMVLLPSPGGTNTVGGTGNSSGGTTVVRKRHFSFQPIPHGQGSLPQSPNTSPFISPRSTPVPMLRSRHSSGSALPLPLHLLPSGPGGGLHKPTQVGPFGSNGSDISRAATFGSTSECSTPFISPHGTPIPFNRSRHNSAQGRLCRSRHSSGLGPYRYNNSTFSPMALNNLNNPYSPQPSTPNATGEVIMMDLPQVNVAGQQSMNQGGVSGNVFLQNTIVNSGNSNHGGVNNVNGLGNIVVNSDVQVGGGGNSLSLESVLADQRSRHNSAESEPPMSMRVSPSCLGPNNLTLGHGGTNSMEINNSRQRHASAGQAQISTNWPDCLNTNDEGGGGGGGDNGGSSGGGGSGFQRGPSQQQSNSMAGGGADDLDLALNDLKDYDHDFSKFVDETENAKK